MSLAAGSAGAQAALDLSTSPTLSQESPHGSATLDAFRSPRRQELLIKHGVNPTSRDLVAFLESGFSDDAMKRGLPTDPETKTEVVAAAIEELGILRSTDAVPLLEQLAVGTFPGGVARVITRDLERTPVGLHDRAASAYRSVLAINAVVALGLIGDTSVRGTLITAMQESADSPFVIECAVALGLLGAAQGMAPLAKLAGSSDPSESTAAFDAVFYISGRNYGVWTETSIERRKQAAQEFATWVGSGAGAMYGTDAAEVLRRRIEGPPRETISQDSVRGLLRATRDPVNQSERMAARTALVDRSDKIGEEVRALALDPLEDNDIRAEAARWYHMIEPEKGSGVLRRLRKDPNQTVAKTAETLLKKK